MRDTAATDPAIAAAVDAHITRAVRAPQDAQGRALVLEPADKAYLLRVARAKVEALFARQPLEAADFPDAPPALLAPGSAQARVFVSLYVDGRLRGCMGTRGDTLVAATLAAADRTVRDKRFDGGALTRSELDRLIIDLMVVLDGLPLASADPVRERRNVDLGVHALTFRLGKHTAFFKADVPVKNGLTLAQTVGRLARKAGLEATAAQDPKARLEIHPCLQFREARPARADDAAVVELFRGRPITFQGEVTRYALERSLRQCAEYLIRHVDGKGNLTYLYDPDAHQRLPAGGNAAMVRRLASAWALAEIATALHYRRGVEAAKRALDALLRLYYVEEDGPGPGGRIGYLKRKEHANVATAGFVLLAICALGDPEFRAEQRDRLAAFVVSQIDMEKGFVYPVYLPDPMENFASKQLYYPGEALFGLMAWVALTGNRAPLAAMDAVLPYYRNLYDTDRNSVNMAAWMSKAYGAAHALTGNPAFADFVLHINDKVVGLQHQPGQAAPDLVGAFTSTGNTSATGVFLESVAEGYRVADVTGDRARAAALRRTLVLGMRYLVQAQYNPRDLLAPEAMAEALGGYPLATNDRQVRVDNVQHCGLALLKTLSYLKPPHGVLG